MSKIIVKKIKIDNFAKNKSEMKKLISVVLMVFWVISPVFAQNTLENFFRTDEKFYVVVAVLAIIMLGILFYVIRLDRKISNLEKQNKETTN
jgi:CcmD family protein